MKKMAVPRRDAIYFCIDLDSKKPEVLEFSGDALKMDLKWKKVSNPVELSDYDRKVFRTEREAQKYLTRFKRALGKLKQLTDGKWRPGPTLIYKRHYLAQTAMNEKLQTYRGYKRDWKPGELLKLHDQTFYIVVRLKSISKTTSGYKYTFVLPKKR